MRKYDRTFKYLVYDSGQLDEAVQDYYRWTALDNTLICAYNDIMTDPNSVVASIADHLMIKLSDLEISRLVEKYCREQQIERIKRFKNSFEYTLLKQLNTIISFAQKRHFSFLERFASKIVGELGYGGHIRDTRSELHPNHIQSGQIGE